MYIALGEAALKTLLDRKPNKDIKATSLKDLLKECNEASQKTRNRLIDRHKSQNKRTISKTKGFLNKRKQKMMKVLNNFGTP